jgi:AcrR family transcriptional regulator
VDRPRLTPRKRPRQARAAETWRAIVQAAGRRFAAEGYGAVTVQAVAELAGVAIGSLYQYFPNKESLATAVLVEVREELLDAVSSALLEAQDELVQPLAQALVEHYDERGPLYAALLPIVPEIGAERKLAPVEERLRRTFSELLGGRGLAHAEERAAGLLLAVEAPLRARLEHQELVVQRILAAFLS